MTAPLALTMGDPAGIGGEIAVAARASGRLSHPFFLIDDPDRIRAIAGALPVIAIAAPEDTAGAWADGLPVLPHPLPAAPRAGRPDPANAPAVA